MSSVPDRPGDARPHDGRIATDCAGEANGARDDDLYGYMSRELALLAAANEDTRSNLARWFSFANSGPWFELQALNVPEGRFENSHFAHADSVDAAATLVARGDTGWSQCPAFYLIANDINPAVATRAPPNEWHIAKKDGGTTEADIEKRLALYIDIDAVRPKGTSATDAEVSGTIDTAARIYSRVASILGDDAPLAVGHSGNGRALFVALDGLAVAQSGPPVKAILMALDAQYSTPKVKIDRSVSDAKRLIPAWGTMKRKGASRVPERPHRRTAFVCGPTIRRLSLPDLERLALTLGSELTGPPRAEFEKALGAKHLNGASLPRSHPNGTPFARANAVPTSDVAARLGIMDGTGRAHCPSCGLSDSGVAVLEHGLKCSHNRCAHLGKSGFRTNIDLVAEVRICTPREAVEWLASEFDFDGFKHLDGVGTRDAAPRPYDDAAETSSRLLTLDEMIVPALARAERRLLGIEKPIRLPWPSLEPHFGGGLWPGVHFLCSGTGIGKTSFGIQAALHAAKQGVPAAYIGLELEDLQMSLRVVGEESRVPWSKLYTGAATLGELQRARAIVPQLLDLPFHFEFGRPQGWPISELEGVAAAMRKHYPEAHGTGSRPILVVLDFLQIIGDEASIGRPTELRERIGRAAYFARDVSSRLGIAVLIISSIAREKYNIAKTMNEAGLSWTLDEAGRPVNRGLLNPDALVGLGKESGEIEYSADSVTTLGRVAGSWVEGEGFDVIAATAKGRVAGAKWAPLHFTGFGYQEPADGGASIVRLLANEKSRSAAGKQLKEAKNTAKAEEKLGRKVADAVKVAIYVREEPGALVREVRRILLRDDARRWTAVKEVLGKSLVMCPGGGVEFDSSKAPVDVISVIDRRDAASVPPVAVSCDDDAPYTEVDA